MTEKEEISLYEKAAENDLVFIKKFIAEHPDYINRACQYHNFRTWHGTGTALLKVSVQGVGALATIVAAPLVSWGFIASMGYTVAKQISEDGKNNRNRKNWSFLDYAAEAGATDVAVWLIHQGADISSTYFIKLARENDHYNFIAACESAMKIRNDLFALNNKLEQSGKMLEYVEASLQLPAIRLLSKRFKLTRLRSEYVSVVERYQRLEAFVRANYLWDEFEQSAPIVTVNDDTLKNPRLFLNDLEGAIGFLSNIVKNTKLIPVVMKANSVLHKLQTEDAICKAELIQLGGASRQPVSAPVGQEAFFAQPLAKDKYIHPSNYPHGLTEIKKAPYEPGDCFLDAVIALIPADEVFDNYYSDMPGKCYDSVQFYHAWQQSSLKKDGSPSDVETLESVSSPYRQWLKTLFRQKVYDQLGASERYQDLLDKEGTVLVGLEEEEYNNIETYRTAVKKPLAYFDDIAIEAFSDATNIPLIIVTESGGLAGKFNLELITTDNPPVFLGVVNNNHFVPLRMPSDKSFETIIDELGIVKDDEEENMQPKGC